MAQVSKAAGVAELGVERPVQPDWQPKLASLIAARGGSMSPIEFQRLVNVVFHDVEAGVYDRVHDEMWKSLRPIVGRLADDALTSGPVGTGLVLADIGCGTGLATTLLLETALGSRVERLELVDTSSEMLARCRRRQSVWRRPAVFRTGGIEALIEWVIVNACGLAQSIEKDHQRPGPCQALLEFHVTQCVGFRADQIAIRVARGRFAELIAADRTVA